MTDVPPGIMHFPQVERTFCNGFPYTEPYFQEKSPFSAETSNANVAEPRV
jgi:hypothetical protein